MADRSAQATFDAPAPDPELQRLAPLLGTWTTQGHTQDGMYGPGVPVASTERFRWLDGGYFLVQEYETTFGEEPTQRGVVYLGLRRPGREVPARLLQQQRPVHRRRQPL